MIKITQKGDFKRTKKFLNHISHDNYSIKIMRKYGELGVKALQNATPIRTGETANSWDYTIKKEGGKYSIVWSNKNIVNGVNVALILQTGHATGTGGYVRGIDYINPALAPVFEGIMHDLWEEVTAS